MKVHKVLRGNRNLTDSISYVTYHLVFRENLTVLYKLCITNKGSPALTKLQEIQELWQNIYHTCFYFPNLPISRKFTCCLS